MPVLKGERICLRDYRSEDFSAISAWINDESTTRWMSTRFWSPQTAVDVQDYLSRMLQSSPTASTRITESTMITTFRLLSIFCLPPRFSGASHFFYNISIMRIPQA